MPQEKFRTSKKRKKKAENDDPVDKTSSSTLIDDFSEKKVKKSLPMDDCGYNSCDDNLLLYERENLDLLETTDGVEYEADQFRQDFPHIANELGNPHLIYPIDAVRWDDEEFEEDNEYDEDELIIPEEPTIESLLSRCKTVEEALEIIKYLEKRSEISSRKAKRLISVLKDRGLKAFK